MSLTYHNKNLVGLIQFIILLDNRGKRIYSKYYIPNEHILSKHANQIDFEKRIAQSVVNFNVNTSNEMDIFSLGEFMILSKINREIAIFVGAMNSDNENIIANFFEVLEEGIENATGNKLTRKGVLEAYHKIVLLIDEMVNSGIIINTDGESIDSKLNSKAEDPSNGYFSSLVGFAKSSLSSAIRK